MQHMTVPYGLPTPPASPLPFDQQYDHQQRCLPTQFHPQQPRYARYIPVAPEQRIGSFLAGSLQLTGILGTGAYGVVYQAVDVKTHTRYAVKALNRFNADGTPLDRRQIDFQMREIRLHYQASSHPNVVSMLRIIDEPDCIYVILEYCPEGDLFLNITEYGHYVGKDELSRKIFLQILDAVEYCHSMGIYHRDLKPENILVTGQGETVKLADFGLATASDRSDDYGCGSTFYMSPECLDHSSRRPFYFCAPNDVWSLGVVLVNLTCGRNPWKQASQEDSTYRAFVQSPGFLKTILPISDELNNILCRIFTANPDQRITLPELKAAIQACRFFTEQPMALSQSAAIPEATAEYVDSADIEIDYGFEPLSPASSAGSLSDDGSCASDESLASSCSSIDDLDDDLCRDLPEVTTPPPPPSTDFRDSVAIYEPEDCRALNLAQQDYMHFPHGEGVMHHPVPHHPQHPGCAAIKPYFPQVWAWFGKYAQPGSLAQPHVTPFHYQVPVFAGH